MQARGRIRHRSEAACARAWGAVLLRCVWRQLQGPKLPLRVSSSCRCHSLSEWRWVAARAGSGPKLGVPAASEAGPGICLLPARTGACGLLKLKPAAAAARPALALQVAPSVAVTVRAGGCCRPAPQRAMAVVSFPPPVPAASTGEGASESVDDRPESPAGLWISHCGTLDRPRSQAAWARSSGQRAPSAGDAALAQSYHTWSSCQCRLNLTKAFEYIPS